MLLSVAHEIADILFIARRHDSGGFHLEDAGVGAVELARKVVAEDFAFEEALQIILESAQIHKEAFQEGDALPG
jgi:hypothetical protein